MKEKEYKNLKIGDYFIFTKKTPNDRNITIGSIYKVSNVNSVGINFYDNYKVYSIITKNKALRNCVLYTLPKDYSNKVNHPSYYNSHPSGVECIDIIRYYNFDVGNVIKYLWRAGLKQEQGYSSKEKELEDCKKALFYLQDHIKQLEKNNE